MALTLRVKQGAKIKIGDAVLRIVCISEETHSIQIAVSGKEFKIDSKRNTEILPGVFAMVGLNPLDDRPQKPRIAITAPRSLLIDRMNDAIGSVTRRGATERL